MKTAVPALLAGLSLTQMPVAVADSISEALTEGKPSLDMRLRYEAVEQDNALQDAKALTLRTRLGYTTGSFNGLSAMIEFEDVRIVGGVDEYSVGPTGFNPGLYSVIADPETTEVDQGFLQYKNDVITAKLGRQVITLDDHRFVGHVGWRQDRQTFDALTLNAAPMPGLALMYGYINNRNRIFAEAADVASKDHLINVSYATPYGKLVGFGYLLEVDNGTDNAMDTYGVRFSGGTDVSTTKLLYTASYAKQSHETAAVSHDADYLFLEAGATFSGITGKIGYEVLGSDNGAYGFSTPLATLHKFNGWSDQFLSTPAQGLVDTYVSLNGKLFGGGWKVVYHDFKADKPSATVDDLGNELDLVYSRKLSKNFNAGIKYASYKGDSGKVDTNKLWLWAGAKF